jgi:hypothetical protein
MKAKAAHNWLIYLLILGGIAYISRALIELSNPNYWRPETFLDYAAVYLSTTLWLVHGLILAIMVKIAELEPGIRKTAWVIAMLVAAFGFAMSGIGNLLEDALGFREVGGFLFSLGIVGAFGLILASIAIWFLPTIRARWGWFLVIPLAAMIISFDNSAFVTGPAMLFLASLEAKRPELI